MPDALAMVKVGNSECEFRKLTPLSRTVDIAGAVSGVTFSARSPSGTNKMRLRGGLFWAKAVVADIKVRLRERMVAQRMKNLASKELGRSGPDVFSSFCPRQNCYDCGA